VFAEIDLPAEDLPWTQAMRARCVSARAVLARHPRATPLMETRTSAGLAEQIVDALPDDDYPHFAALTRQHVLQPGYGFGSSFEVGLDLVRDGLDRMARAEE
jgi:hypothetical protein